MAETPRRARQRARLIARRGAALAVAGMLIASADALAVQLSAGSAYTGKSRRCHATVPGTTCVFSFRASDNGYALRLVGPTVVSSWACRQGDSEALLGGKVAGNDPVPLIRLRSNGTLYGTVGSGPNRVQVSGRIGEAGTKAMITFRLVNRDCVSPKLTLIEGAPAHG